jgi:3-methyl-2-oxobutanoate hydroxymethyltransferase
MPKVTVADILQMKGDKKKIAVMTAYYYEMARVIDRAEPDMILVGDSGGGFLLGHQDNNDVTLDEMILMTRSVARGASHALVIGDLPFMTYQISVEDAVRNAGRLVKESRCDAVKLEGGQEFADVVKALVTIGIPVQAHMGRTPMTSAAVGGMQSDVVLDTDRLYEDARALQEAGAFSVILTGITPDVAFGITKELRVPTISGYGAGDDCDGDIGVSPGTLGWTAAALDRDNNRYGSVAKAIYDSASSYIQDVRDRKPTRSNR